jgi:hypothetical protein
VRRQAGVLPEEAYKLDWVELNHLSQISQRYSPIIVLIQEAANRCHVPWLVSFMNDLMRPSSKTFDERREAAC